MHRSSSAAGDNGSTPRDELTEHVQDAAARLGGPGDLAGVLRRGVWRLVDDYLAEVHGVAVDLNNLLTELGTDDPLAESVRAALHALPGSRAAADVVDGAADCWPVEEFDRAVDAARDQIENVLAEVATRDQGGV